MKATWPIRPLTLVAAVLFAGGCIPFLHPLYTQDTVRFEEVLLGVWEVNEDEGTWTFERGNDENSYRLITVDEDGEEGTFDAYLVDLGDALYLDLLPKEPKPDGNDLYVIHLLRSHGILLVMETEPVLKLALPDPEWLGKKLEDEGALSYERADERLVVTAPTEDLQAFFRECADHADAFCDPIELIRRGPRPR